jgi:hypothetical protein
VQCLRKWSVSSPRCSGLSVRQIEFCRSEFWQASRAVPNEMKWLGMAFLIHTNAVRTFSHFL